MPPLNITDTHIAGCFLTGIPGLEHLHIWLSILFCVMYVAALAGNSILISVIISQRSLHGPIYLFISMPARTDVLLSTSSIPKALTIFWLGTQAISFNACLTQTFCIHFLFMADSAILLAMAFDCYVDICSPLHYNTILTPTIIRKIAGVILTHCFCILFPSIFLLKRLPYCQTNIISHTFCDHMGIAWLTCADISVNEWYGLAAVLLSIRLDIILIAISYALILRTVFHLPSHEAQLKELGMCGSHIGVTLLFYTPALFSAFAYHFGRKNFPHYVHILQANLCVIIPPVLSPVIYSVRTKQIWQEAVQMFLQLGM